MPNVSGPEDTLRSIEQSGGAYGDRMAMRLNYVALSRMAAMGMSNKEIAARAGIRSGIVAGLKAYYGLAGARRGGRAAPRP